MNQPPQFAQKYRIKGKPSLRNRGWKERYPRPMMGIESCGMLISAVHHEEGEEKLHLLMLDKHIPAGAKMY